jgi:small conductance mechanosensitive channel
MTTVMRTSTIVFTLWITLIANLSFANELTELITGDAKSQEALDTDKVIEVNSSVQDDKKIQTRLQKIFSEMDNLKKITIQTSNGIVTLQGEVSSAAAENKAIQLAQQVKGVIEVNSELFITHDVKERLETTWQKLAKTASSLLTGLPVFLLAIIAFAFTIIFGQWLSRRQSLYRKIAPNYFIASLLGQMTRLIFIVLGLVFALSLLDLTTLLGSILGAAGIFGLAVGFAVRDTVENYIASILLSLRNPFEVNDLVNIDGNEGNVVRLTTRATILLSQDGNHIRIPNAIVFKAVIINYTRNSDRRFQFDIGIAANHDLQIVQSLALKTLHSIEGVLNEPKPMAMIEELGDFNIILRIYAWTDQDKFDFLKVRSETIRQTKSAFDQANIVMPEPTYQIKIENEASIDLKQNHKTDPENTYPVDKPSQLATHGPIDISTDKTIEKKVAQEHEHSDTLNLLDENASQE